MHQPLTTVIFPPPVEEDEIGLVLVGGQLTVDWLISAYSQGIFPWPTHLDGQDILAWYSPNPRAIMPLDGFHVSRRLRRRLRSRQFTTTFDQYFDRVVAECSLPRADELGTWITPDLRAAYGRLHECGLAHSVEVWEGEDLVGGLYGVALGACFAGESMFYRRRDASKVAMACLVEHLNERGYQLFDVQIMSDHLMSLGAVEIPRFQFLALLEDALQQPVAF